MPISISTPNPTVKDAIDGTYCRAWLARRESLAATRAGASDSSRVCGRYEGVLSELGNLLGLAGAKVFVSDSAAQKFDESGIPYLTLIPCLTTVEDMLVEYARAHGMFEPELDAP